MKYEWKHLIKPKKNPNKTQVESFLNWVFTSPEQNSSTY